MGNFIDNEKGAWMECCEIGAPSLGFIFQEEVVAGEVDVVRGFQNQHLYMKCVVGLSYSDVEDSEESNSCGPTRVTDTNITANYNSTTESEPTFGTVGKDFDGSEGDADGSFSMSSNHYSDFTHTTYYFSTCEVNTHNEYEYRGSNSDSGVLSAFDIQSYYYAGCNVDLNGSFWDHWDYRFNDFDVSADDYKAADGSDESGGITLSEVVDDSTLEAVFSLDPEWDALSSVSLSNKVAFFYGVSASEDAYTGDLYSVRLDKYRVLLGYERDVLSGFKNSWFEVEYGFYKNYENAGTWVEVDRQIVEWSGTGVETETDASNYLEINLPVDEVTDASEVRSYTARSADRYDFRILRYRPYHGAPWIDLNDALV
ncbi:hypothetical protein ACFPK9_01300 [Rubritalea spongiae]|uniref:F5/8 type C domain-containing protein n=1 Tax=Rubritalea spongiae TaxID=430797 RepID=A0ABW5DZL7_9BACT